MLHVLFNIVGLFHGTMFELYTLIFLCSILLVYLNNQNISILDLFYVFYYFPTYFLLFIFVYARFFTF
jgi:hypothetical protein